MQGKFNNKAQSATPKTKIGIALQGGGAYGAYAKGVLETLLQSSFINQTDIRAVTGTSAGAMNGALLTYGLNKGGPQVALKTLDQFWDSIKNIGQTFSLWNGLNPALNPDWPNIPQHKMLLFSFAQAALPRDYALSQLKQALVQEIPDLKPLQNGATQLFVNAVSDNNTNGGRIHTVFKGQDLDHDSLIASGALEQLGGWMVNGTRHYDGAYWRNPCFDDILKTDITDLFVISLQARPNRPLKPRSQDDVRDQDHAKPGFSLITSEIHDHLLHLQQAKPKLHLHHIAMDVQPHWNETSRMNTDPQWLNTLENMGRKDAQDWLKNNLSALGQHSSYNLLSPSQKPKPPRKKP